MCAEQCMRTFPWTVGTLRMPPGATKKFRLRLTPTARRILANWSARPQRRSSAMASTSCRSPPWRQRARLARPCTSRRRSLGAASRLGRRTRRPPPRRRGRDAPTSCGWRRRPAAQVPRGAPMAAPCSSAPGRPAAAAAGRASKESRRPTPRHGPQRCRCRHAWVRKQRGQRRRRRWQTALLHSSAAQVRRSPRLLTTPTETK
mmetsp:Transcript_58868/g.165176  ORF Transcript_58868/g.165176 Transcript_58868/m.165176 type:complete len:203 (+) Transcript_58868:401-1009(+)